MLNTRNRLGGIGLGPVTRHLSVTVDETVIGRLHTAVLVGDIAYTGTGDELLTFVMPPSSRPMITSTMAISTKVKPCWWRTLGMSSFLGASVVHKTKHAACQLT